MAPPENTKPARCFQRARRFLWKDSLVVSGFARTLGQIFLTMDGEFRPALLDIHPFTGKVIEVVQRLVSLTVTHLRNQRIFHPRHAMVSNMSWVTS